jgi:hypothetical protein
MNLEWMSDSDEHITTRAETEGLINRLEQLSCGFWAVRCSDDACVSNAFNMQTSRGSSITP